MGMWGSGWLLAARVHDSFGIITSHAEDFATQSYQVWEQTDPDQLPTYAYTADIFPEHPHFPYGADVEPD